MNWFTAFATFLIIWWLSLFIVLPIGVRGQAEEEDIVHGTEPGAPIRSQMGKKFLWTTALSIFLFILTYVIVSSGYFTWERMGAWFGMTQD